MNWKNLLFIITFILICTEKSVGQFFIDPYRFAVSRYFEIEELKKKKKYYDNYIDLHALNKDSIRIELGDTTVNISQWKYRRTKKNRRILFFYFQRRKFSSPTKANGFVIENCRIIEIRENKTYCLCRVTDKTRERIKINQRIITINNGDLEGVILGMGRTPRILLIAVIIINFAAQTFEIR